MLLQNVIEDDSTRPFNQTIQPVTRRWPWGA